MNETTILIPVTDNHGRPYHASKWEELENGLLDLAGGWTYLGETRGKWIDHHGRTFTDVCRMYAVQGVSRSRLDGLIGDIKRAFGQHSIYCRFASASIL